MDISPYQIAARVHPNCYFQDGQHSDLQLEKS